MPYLIDGHNLVPKFGIALSSENDEEQLVAILQEFSRLSRKGLIEIYFDRAANGTQASKIHSFLKVYFSKGGKKADDEILERLGKMGLSAKNWTVVSSDGYVQRESRRLGATVLTSDEFVRLVRSVLSAPRESNDQQKPMSQSEMEEWMRLFDERDGNKYRPPT